ncbi:uncharacterized protein SAPINGB_P006314 [Magnusiomyces paraingens]|uniref:OPT family small oligopeptide transporter n=1 Tax=Magnusiomyces paraingens TaxID=2606893 RepID=A0A5E8C9G6_9ASCO|nr:uncharacterized protein SAPINGB_P006314 [Saprochaete ingens]VVT58648.1 unnamed protein product [Saprochaete ingens]
MSQLESKNHDSTVTYTTDIDYASFKEASESIQDDDVLVRFGQDPSSDDEDPVAAYLYKKYREMTLSEAVEILKEAIVYHENDVNFPMDVLNKIEKIVEGPEKYGEDIAIYQREAKIEATFIRWHSPYPEVRAITDPFDDPDTPCDTIRAYFLGFVWSIIGTGVNQFFSPRQPSISLSSGILQILLLPCGKALEYVLPKWSWSFRGERYSLNPGPWTYKEQMFATIIFNVSIGGAYAAFYNIIVEKLPMYYNNQWATIGYQFLLVFSTQFLGFGFAGIMRRLIVYPVRAVWPTILPPVALNKALAAKEPKKCINGWTITKYKFFLIVFSAAFLYFWLPNYLFAALSTFNWMTWIAPNNFNLATITGSIGGLGINPIASFDWTVINYNSPLTIPFYSFLNQYIGTLIAGCVLIPAVFWTNYKWTGYFPINSNHIFANDGTTYKVSKVLTNGLLDIDKYQSYSPPFYTAANLVVYGSFFALYPFAIIYSFVTDWVAIKRSCLDLWEAIRNPRRSNYAGHDDVHSQMMSKYKEVPDWWFLVVLVISLALGIAMVEHYPTNTPVWGIFFTIGINFIFLIPITLIYSVTGFSFGLNVLVELIVGYAIPGNGTALNILKAYGYNIDGQAQNYITDQKMGHYAKIPPRAMFKGQIISTLFQVLVSVGVVNWQISNIEDLCTSHQEQKFTCPGPNTFFSASVFWGVIGPKRVFGGLYPILQWCFLIGALLPIPFLMLRKFFPKTMRYFQPTLIIGGMLQYAPYNLTYFTGGLYLSYIFNYHIRRRYLAWWEKYNYVLSASLTAGVAFSAIIIFFAVQYHDKSISWWGNNVPYNGQDYAGNPLLEIPDGSYVGPRIGAFP